MKIESHSQGHSQAAQWPSSARGASLGVSKACQGAAEMSYCWVVLLIPWSFAGWWPDQKSILFYMRTYNYTEILISIFIWETWNQTVDSTWRLAQVGGVPLIWDLWEPKVWRLPSGWSAQMQQDLHIYSLQDTHIDIDIDGKIDKKRKKDRTIEG